MSNDLVVAYIGLGGIIIGVLLAGPVTYYYSKRLIIDTHQNDLEVVKITEFNKAAATFRSAFVDVQFLLRDAVEKGGVNPNRILTDTTIITHEKAKISFEPFIEAVALSSFNDAWDKYKNYYDSHVDYLLANQPSITGKKYERDFSNFCLNLLDSLLAFTQPK